MSTDEYTCSGWACVDCLMELANGEAPPDLTETEQAERDARMIARNAGYNLTLGMLREDHACATNYTVTADGAVSREYLAGSASEALEQAESDGPASAQTWTVAAHELQTAGDAGGECDCETVTFSWSPCDVCGSNLGGARHAVSFWKITEG